MKALPNSIDKRDLLYGAKKAGADTFLTLAKKYEIAGSYSDALDFFHKAESASDLERLRQVFVDEGDAFLLSKLAHFSSDLITDGDFKKCAAKAESAGKTRYAILAYERLGDEDKVEALKESIADDGDIIAEREAETFVAPNLEEIQQLEDEEE